ncbi:MAG: response regulator transcription factor [Deltaproteobacteria bacterium]|nr:response regulator transcription factor [Deltaproteobacteria bacterium]MBW2016350.1 response regulator transcription factor [Deltaproteobacteria bacterium]MBW2130901.1 response regulator transcription factor [Deltaproteobacteria bacterium]MBW2303999.1 response regulator transcription factor [Deltaproteobacteria bacterium]
MQRILLVEDDPVFRLTFRKILVSRFPSLALDEARDGKEALDRIKVHPPDLVFMDLKLPGENGLEVTQKVKELYPEVVVIILTSHDFPEYRQAATEKGANYFLSKHSSSTEEILDLVRTICFP